MKKMISLLLILTLASTLFIGCSNKKESNTATNDITNDTTNDTAATTDGTTESDETVQDGTTEREEILSGKIVVASNRTDIEETLNTYAQKFMELHPGTTVEFETIKDYDTVIPTRIAGGEAPDLFYVVDPINQSTYSEYFMPIDDLSFTKEDILFYENGRGEDGVLYVLPLTVSYCGMIYNKQAFASAGISEVPRTIDEFWDVCDKLNAAGITPVGTAFKDIWPIYPWCGESEVNVTAGNAQGKHGYPYKDEIYDEVMLNSVNIIRELNKKGYLEEDVMSANWDQFKLDLAQAKVAMHYSETWLPSQFVELGANQEDIGMFPFPGAKNIKAGAGKQWGVSKTTSSPELAKAFLSYMLENPVEATEIPSNVNIEVSDPFVSELLSYGVEPLEEVNGDSTFDKIRNEIELDEQSFLLTYVMEKDDVKVKQMIDDWNAKWAAARKNYVE